MLENVNQKKDGRFVDSLQISTILMFEGKFTKLCVEVVLFYK